VSGTLGPPGGVPRPAGRPSRGPVGTVAGMARIDLRNGGNAAGEWFVDTRCIDCGTCREIAPGLFDEAAGRSVVGRQPVVVHAVDDRLADAVGRGGDQDALGAGVQVALGLVLGREDARALKGDVHAQLAMRQLGGVLDGGAADGARADVDAVASDRDRAREAAVSAVVAEQVGVGFDRAQVVDRHHLDVAPPMLDDGAQHQPADAAKAVDGDAKGHGRYSQGLLRAAVSEPGGGESTPPGFTARFAPLPRWRPA